MGLMGLGVAYLEADDKLVLVVFRFQQSVNPTVILEFILEFHGIPRRSPPLRPTLGVSVGPDRVTRYCADDGRAPCTFRTFHRSIHAGDQDHSHIPGAKFHPPVPCRLLLFMCEVPLFLPHAYCVSVFSHLFIIPSVLETVGFRSICGYF